MLTGEPVVGGLMERVRLGGKSEGVGRRGCNCEDDAILGRELHIFGLAPAPAPTTVLEVVIPIVEFIV